MSLVKTKIKEHIVIVELDGDFALNSCPEVRSAFTNFVDQGYSYFIFDARRIEYCDSDGLGVLLNVEKLIRPTSGAMVFVSHEKHSFYSILRLAGLNKIFPVVTSIQDGIDMLTGCPSQHELAKVLSRQATE